MSNFYKYLDKNFTYIDEKTGILKNLLDITDENTLVFVESGLVTKKLNELSENPIKISSIESLFYIHKHLFNEIYIWAGEKRTVEISKDGKQFFPTMNFENAFQYINSLISEFKKINKNDRLHLSEKLAEILDNVNYLHPFREGNGRAQREFLRLIAWEKGLILNLNPIDNPSVYERYMKGTINSDMNILSKLIFELISEPKK